MLSTLLPSLSASFGNSSNDLMHSFTLSSEFHVANQTVLWYRAAELKHSRVAMLATSGWIANAMGVSFPGELSQEDGLTFSSLSHNPLEAWDAVPETLKYQMLGAIGLVEILAETAKVGSYLCPVVWPILETVTTQLPALRSLRIMVL